MTSSKSWLCKLRVIFSKVQTGVIYQCHRFCSNSARCDLLLKKSHCQDFLPPSRHYDLLFCEGEKDKPTELPKVGSYIIIRKGKTVWYPGLVMNADNDGNEIEVKFMYPSRNKRNKFNFGNVDLMWCPVEMLSLCVNLQSVIRKNCIRFKTIPSTWVNRSRTI